jgi:hypothetical protein
MFIILLILNYYTFVWDYTIGAILLLCIIALIFDYVVFTNKGFKKIVNTVSTNDYFFNFEIDDEPKYIALPDKPKEKSDSIYDVIIKDIKHLLDEVYPGQPAPITTSS